MFLVVLPIIASVVLVSPNQWAMFKIPMSPGSRSSQKHLDGSRTTETSKRDLERRIAHLDEELKDAVVNKNYNAVADMGLQRNQLVLRLQSSFSGPECDAEVKAHVFE